jgi:Protein of unknown function (DUF2934)
MTVEFGLWKGIVFASLPRVSNQQKSNEESGAMQIQLSPAHPDRDKIDRPQLEERIRSRAYELYEERGRGEGRALDDWLEAKAEVLGVVKHSKAA